MNKYNIDRKTLIFSPDFEKGESIKVYDERNILFYDSDWASRFKGLFFLPKGIYFCENELSRSRAKLKRPKIIMPRRERNLNHNWKDFNIEFGNNPNKCSIYHNKKLILFDKSFENRPMYQLAFMIYHEKGHNYYSTEKFADMYAVRQMLNIGYNPSQIVRAPLVTLSDKSNDRKNYILNKFVKYYNNE